MAMIFPGMDPYLEDPQVWQGFHARLVVYVGDHLQSLLGSRYIAAVEERVYVEGPQREILPDVWVRRSREEQGETGAAVAEADAPLRVQVPELEIHEAFVEILDRQSGMRVVTVIEVVSPSNKFPGPGRESYRAKQREVLSSQAHLVEIDLLRAGQHLLSVPEWVARGRAPYDYLVCVNRAEGARDWYELYPRRLRQRLPRVAIPLAEGDADVPLDLQAVVERTYQAGSYRYRLAYDRPCVPPLESADQAWAEGLIRAAAHSR